MSSQRAGVILAALGGLASAALAFAADAPPAYANPTFANPDTPGLAEGRPAPDATNATDILVLKALAKGGRAEVELGKLAEQRAAAPDVDAFGHHMVQDHGATNAKLAAVARAAKVELPKDLDRDHAAVRDRLGKLDGAGFDIAYLESQIKDHQQAAQLLMHEIASGQNSGARAFAADTLPAVMQHLETARNLHAMLTGAAGVAMRAPGP